MAKLKVSLNFKKMDFTKVKQFLLHTGEKIILGVVVLLGIWLVWGGLSAASVANKDKSGTPLATILDKGAKNYEAAIQNAAIPPIPPTPTDRPWLTILSHLTVFGPYFQLNEDPDQLRREPNVLPLYRDIQVDFLKAGISAYDIDILKQKATVVVKGGGDKEAGELGQTILPTRMLIVSALFPLREQTEEFQRALKMPFGIEKDEDKPQILGINVEKIERDPNNPKAQLKPSKLYSYFPDDDKVKITDRITEKLDDFFRRSLPDPDALKPFANHNKFGGLVITNMPKLASGKYPQLKMGMFLEVKEDNETEKDPKPGTKPPRKKKDPDNMPKGIDTGKKQPAKGADAPLGKVEKIDWADNKDAAKMASRWNGEYPVFDGQAVAGGDDVKKDDPMKKNFPMLPPPRDPNPMKKKTPFDKKDKKDKDKEEEMVEPLIRFFDVDVKPGFEYAYRIQVVLKNPNFGKEDLVSLKELAEKKELLSDWTTTRFTRVPSEMPNWYVVDQHYEPEPPPEKDKEEPKLINPKDFKGIVPKKEKKKEEVKKGPQPRGPDFAKADNDRAAIQIQRWFDYADVPNKQGIIADWIVAERLLVRRGDYIGRPEVVVEAPTWSIQRNDYELINIIPPEKPDKKSLLPKATGIKLDFNVGAAPPVVVDFEGGHRKLKSGFLEDCPLEMLVVTGDGKLMVHNSRDDAFDKVRIERYEVYRERLKEHARPEIKEEDKEKEKKGFPKGGKMK